MKSIQQLSQFLEAATDNPRLTPAHISLYAALLHYWELNEYQSPISINRAYTMRLCKISGRSTYQKCMQELHDYGYIRYIPSFNHFIGSLIYLSGFPDCIAKIQLQKK